MSRYTKGQKRIERARETHPFLVTAPASICPLTAQRFGPCIAAETDRGVRTFAFRFKRHADRFAALISEKSA